MKVLFLSLMLALASSTSQAREVVNLAWPWGPGDADSAFTRTMIEKLNQTQDHEKFLD